MRKHIKLYILLSWVLMITLAWSCGENENLEPLGNWELSMPTLTTPGAGTDIVLNEGEPSAKFKFEWSAAVASNRFIVAYTYLLVPQGSTDYDNPILSVIPANGGKETFVEPTAEQIDYALWAACYPAGTKVNLSWVVIAKAIEKTAIATQNISFTRFTTEREITALYLTGSATEGGADATKATLMRGRKNAEGNLTQVFDIYTNLTAGGTYFFTDKPAENSKVYGGSDGTVQPCGSAITAPTTGVYRIVVNLNTNSYELLAITKWSLVGDAIVGGWGGDVPLAYTGNGIWSGKIDFVNAANFIFRANGDWSYIIKRIEGTATPDNAGGRVIMESEAGDAGVTFQDVPAPLTGMHTVTLDLSAEGYTYSLVSDTPVNPQDPAAVIGESANPNADNVSGNFDFGTYDVPGQLFLVQNGNMIAEFVKNGDVFESEKFIPLEASKKYILNSVSDGSGQTYNELEADGTIAVARDQAYQLTVNFGTGKLVWKYFNIKLFHWDDAGGGWDARQEILMTYEHPHTFKITGASLSAGFDSKFISPWDIQFGSSGTALTGTMTNGGANYMGIVSSGTYNATIVADDTYATCTYTFVKQ
ncbi:MAG: SusF/SusE family outer membrane protein [Cyclobacteriaceae bacterium]|nr:SusF/SusE family outer membrane protein [Cyclobacteriaceae bacterium]